MLVVALLEIYAGHHGKHFCIARAVLAVEFLVRVESALQEFLRRSVVMLCQGIHGERSKRVRYSHRDLSTGNLFRNLELTLEEDSCGSEIIAKCRQVAEMTERGGQTNIMWLKLFGDLQGLLIFDIRVVEAALLECLPAGLH